MAKYSPSAIRNASLASFIRVLTGRELITAPGNARSAGRAATCAWMVAVARSSSKVASRAVHGPNGISFRTVTSGRSRSTNRVKVSHASVSGESSSGIWQIAIFIRVRSPDVNPLRGCQIQRIPRLDIERLIPCIEVANRGDAITFRRVIAGGNLLAQSVVAVLAAPGAREADEELAILLPDEGLVIHLVAERSMIGVKRRGKAREVGDILDQRACAIDRQVGKRGVARELSHERGGGGLVAGHVECRPPAKFSTGGIVVGAERVDEVTHFVRDDRTDGAVVHGVGGRWIVLGRLQERRGEVV